MIEIFGALEQHPSKGHDRLLLDAVNNRVAVLDGAGNDRGSAACIEMIKTLDTDSIDPKVLVNTLDKEAKIRHGQTTLVMAQLISPQLVRLINCGDSSIHVVDEQGVDTWSVDCQVENDRYYVDTTSFLGSSRRSEADLLGNRNDMHLIKDVQVEADKPFSIVLHSDGIVGTRSPEHEDDNNLSYILATTGIAPGYLEETVLREAFRVDDDVAYAVLNYRPD